MSRVGSKEINIPESVKINLQDGLISAEGPLGKLESKINSQIEVIVEGQKIIMKPKSDDKTLVSFWGCLLYTSPSPRDVEESRMPSSA